MKTAIHPAVFLAGAIALSGTWLWLRSLDDAPAAVLAATLSVGQQSQRPAPRRSVAVDAATLRLHAGNYDFEGNAIIIGIDDGELYVDAGTLGHFALIAESETKFAFAAMPGVITFYGRDGQPSERFVVDLPAGRFTAKRTGE